MILRGVEVQIPDEDFPWNGSFLLELCTQRPIGARTPPPLIAGFPCFNNGRVAEEAGDGPRGLDSLDSVATTRVLLIRHGETPWNRDRRWQGHADIPLSAEGVEQAARLAGHLGKGAPVRALYTSDLQRAHATAAAIGKALGLDPIVDPAWREMEVGSWTGLSREEIKERFAEEWKRIAGGEDVRRGGGETFAEFSARIVAALGRTRDAHSQDTVAVVTHGGVIRAALLYALELPFSRLREVAAVENTAVSELLAGSNGWEVVRRNEVTHLSGELRP